MTNIQQFTNLEELYNRKGEPTGELIIDAVIDAIRNSKTHRSEDIALLLNVEPRALTFAVQMLTGVRLKEFILHWRVLQAKEMWDGKYAGYKGYKDFVKSKSKDAPEGYELTKDSKKAYQREISIKSLEEIAIRYGWDSYKSLQRTARKYGITFKPLRFVTKNWK
jgi:AraC-like DNA-binding protein